MLRILLIICASLSIISCANKVDLECKYDNLLYSSFPLGIIDICCKVQNDPNVISKNLQIDSVSENVPADKTIDDVQGIEIDGKTVNYIPKGLHKFFRNLILIKITSSQLKEIHHDDFKFVPNLKVLTLQQNELEVIDKDSFKFNKNLEVINLGLNKIRFIHPSAFHQLPKLVQLYLSSNKCIDEDELYYTGVRELIERAKTQCSENVK